MYGSERNLKLDSVAARLQEIRSAVKSLDIHLSASVGVRLQRLVVVPSDASDILSFYDDTEHSPLILQLVASYEDDQRQRNRSSPKPMITV